MKTPTKTKKLLKAKILPAKAPTPLTEEEYVLLEELLEKASDYQRDLFAAARDFDAARNRLELAAEDLRGQQEKHQAVMQQLAPLMHRLPRA